MTAVPVPDSPLAFDDVVGIALALSDSYVFVQAALLLDESHRCLDLVTFTGPRDKPWHTYLDARDVSADLIGAALRASSPALVAITVGAVDREVLHEADLEHFRAIALLARTCGLHLMDWLVTDGDLVRSFAELTGRGWDGP